MDNEKNLVEIFLDYYRKGKELLKNAIILQTEPGPLIFFLKIIKS